MQQIDTAMEIAKLEEARKEKLDDRMGLVDDIMEILLQMAHKRSSNREQEKDFIQEGIVCALEMFDRYGDKPRKELVLMTGKAIFRRICSNLRTSISYERKHVFRSSEFEIDQTESEDWDYETLNFIKVLKTRLSAVEKRILQEKIEPSDDIVGIMLQEKAKKKERKDDGYLVMNLNSETITNMHIAEGLNVSNATVSRGLKRIQEEVEHLMCGRFHRIHRSVGVELKH